MFLYPGLSFNLSLIFVIIRYISYWIILLIATDATFMKYNLEVTTGSSFKKTQKTTLSISL